MREYALMTLNMIEYDGIYLEKKLAEYARILNGSDAVHNIRPLYKLLNSYLDRRIQNTVKRLRWGVSQKNWGWI